jgi:hypothetical protein
MAYIRFSKQSSIYIVATCGDGEGIDQDFICQECSLNDYLDKSLEGYRELGKHFLLHFLLMEVEPWEAMSFIDRFIGEAKEFSVELATEVEDAYHWMGELQSDIYEETVKMQIEKEHLRVKGQADRFPFIFSRFSNAFFRRFMNRNFYPVVVTTAEQVNAYQAQLVTTEIPADIRYLIGDEYFNESGKLLPEYIEQCQPRSEEAVLSAVCVKKLGYNFNDYRRFMQ